jgi:hypothetical protein
MVNQLFSQPSLANKSMANKSMANKSMANKKDWLGPVLRVRG